MIASWQAAGSGALLAGFRLFQTLKLRGTLCVESLQSMCTRTLRCCSPPVRAAYISQVLTSGTYH
jgi:hypothetical protein